MLYLRLSAAILLLNFARHSLGFLMGNGSCPTNMTSIGNLDLNRYLGKWYVQAMYPLQTKRLPKCKSMNFVKIDNRYYIETIELDRSNIGLTKRYMSLQRFDTNKGAYFINQYKRTFPRGVDINILNTDYDNYMIEYMCINSAAVFNMQWAIVGTRTRGASSEVLYDARDAALKAGLDVKPLVQVQQDSCPLDT
ncbi:hypothetical protein KR093_007100 [Drosophila rubida]|uniref:Lipocalin/cytosolic fatty-acid binding domain-containing protein n=1 Tax=Drosophila rubida TaxID=30044 RepID=A0AAD4PP70_9MUSC|nr:hypothetical protein KR093_007100 [Drosophila rubida]